MAKRQMRVDFDKLPTSSWKTPTAKTDFKIVGEIWNWNDFSCLIACWFGEVTITSVKEDGKVGYPNEIRPTRRDGDTQRLED